MNLERQVSRVIIEKIENIEGSDFLDKYVLSNKNQVVWSKGKFEEGETVLYIAEASLLPMDLICRLGLDGKLAGSQKNRVKAIKLRGVYSEGLIMKDEIKNSLGESLADEYLDKGLRVTKYRPVVPATLSGAVVQIDDKLIHSFGVRKDYEHIPDDALVTLITEKIHGTNVRIGKIEGSHEDLFGKDKNIYICSKGLGNKGQVFKNTVDNSYVKIFKRYEDVFESMEPGDYMVGEVYGNGVQDLKYGKDGIELAVIDTSLKNHGLPEVPAVFEGTMKFKAFMESLNVENLNSVASDEDQIAEGIVATIPGYGFVKRIAQRYKLRKGGSEYN